MQQTIKILLTTDYGAGWSTWHHDPKIKRILLTYQPIIDALEQGANIHENHHIVVEMEEKIKTKLKNVYICTRGAKNLSVVEVKNIPFIIGEFCGKESFEYISAKETL
jgi:hypothetical protein